MFNDKSCEAVFAGTAESLAVTVKLDVPDTRGLPEITPAVLKVSPLGRIVDDQVYEGVPPEAARLGGA